MATALVEYLLRIKLLGIIARENIQKMYSGRGTHSMGGLEGKGSRQKFRGQRRDLRFVNLIQERSWRRLMIL